MFFGHSGTTDLDMSLFPSHMHSGFEILYFVDGDADYMIEGTVYPLRKGDLLFIKPRTYHNLLPLSNAYYERFVINFTKHEVSQDTYARAMLLPEAIGTSEEPFVKAFFNALKKYQSLMSKAEFQSFLASGVELLTSVLRFAEPREQKDVRQTGVHLKAVLEYIDGHPEQRVSLEQLAKMFYLSPSWLSHMFKQKMGVSLMWYAEHKRVLYAQKLISEGENPTKAAELCGYDNYSTFFRQYKKSFGASPREYTSADGEAPGRNPHRQRK